MKNILLFLFLVPLVLSATHTKPTTVEPQLVLEMGLYSEQLANDTELCCVYEFCLSDSLAQDVTLVRHKATGVVLGTIYGTPNREFLNQLALQFTPQYIADVIRATQLVNKQQ